MRAFATLLAAIGMTLGSMAFADTADATRPIPGFHYTDQCRNIKGLQPSYQMVGTGPYRFVDREHKICRYRGMK